MWDSDICVVFLVLLMMTGIVCLAHSDHQEISVEKYETLKQTIGKEKLIKLIKENNGRITQSNYRSLMTIPDKLRQLNLAD